MLQGVRKAKQCVVVEDVNRRLSSYLLSLCHFSPSSPQTGWAGTKLTGRGDGFVVGGLPEGWGGFSPSQWRHAEGDELRQQRHPHWSHTGGGWFIHLKIKNDQTQISPSLLLLLLLRPAWSSSPPSEAPGWRWTSRLSCLCWWNWHPTAGPLRRRATLWWPAAASPSSWGAPWGLCWGRRPRPTQPNSSALQWPHRNKPSVREGGET